MKKGIKLPYFVMSVSIILCMFFLFAYSFIGNGSNVQAKEESDVFEECIKSVFPMVSRGAEIRERPAIKRETEDNFYKKMISNVYPVMARGEALTSSGHNTEGIISGEEIPSSIKNSQSEIKEASPENIAGNFQIVTSEKVKFPEKVSFDFSKPVVYIYHTHATESYRPVTENNFHSTDEPGTVREAGERLAHQLRSKGIQVIHDKTLHDYPSYNESYRRSLDTIKKGLEKNESVKIIIDLHRDASDYKTVKTNFVTINGKKAAKYSLVVGSDNENSEVLNTFADFIMYKSKLMYPELGEGIILKPYKFNQYVSDYYILMELGDNENNIEEALITAEYFAEILYSVICDIKK
ncbi:MAG: stage II sporulation protein P [Clostridiales bacterium]|nr:stage II sporulation protein P [Clostridiales bacterium]